MSALLLSASPDQRVGLLGERLGALAQFIRDQVSMRLRIETARARLRSSARFIILFSVAFAAGLMLLNRSYLTPYNDPLGQLVLVLVGLCFGGAFWWLSQMSRVEPPERFLTAPSVGALSGGPR